MTLFWIIIAGMIVGFIFDFYRSFRRWQNWGRVLTFIGDVGFSLVALVILFRFFERANALAFRFYIIWGSLLGLVLYLKMLSHFCIRFFGEFFKFITYITELIFMALKVPIKCLVLIMKPFYAVLLWISLLLFRIGEYIFLEPTLEIIKRLKSWWNNFLPPKIKG